MIRRFALTALLLSLPGLAFADEPRADGGSLEREGLTFDDLELLPLDDTRRELVALKHARVWDRLHYLGRKQRDARRRLLKRKNQQDKEARRLRKQVEQLEKQLEPLLAELREALREHGVGDDQLATLKRLKPAAGPRRDYRYAHKLVAAVPGLDRDPARRDRIARVVHGLDGAQLALLSQRKAIEATLRELGGEALDKKQRGRLKRMLIRNMERQVGRMERRFWRLSDHLLTASEMRWVRRHLPRRLTRISDALGHLFRIPGLEPAQAARLKALFAELNSEATADQAEARRLGLKLRSMRRRPWKEQVPVRDELRAVRLRVVELRFRIQQAGRKVLTPAQYAHLMAVPPQVTTRERRLPLRRILEGTKLSPEQREKVRGIQREVAASRRSAYAEAGRINRMGSNFGPDSPQQQTMQMMRLGMEGEATAALSKGVKEVFLEVLSPQQVVSWVVAR